jgi:hypothetical protein
MNEHHRGIALLCGVAPSLAERIANALGAYGVEARALVDGDDSPPGLPQLAANLRDPESIEAALASLDHPLKALINHRAQPLVIPSLHGQPLLRDVAYAPYELYRAAIRHMPAGGNIVSLFGDTGPTPEPQALTLPALKKVTQDIQSQVGAAGVCMNGVSVRYVAGVSEQVRERILAARIAMIADLAQTDSREIDGEFLRGYMSEMLEEGRD